VQDKVFPVMGFGFLRFSCMREGPVLFHENCYHYCVDHFFVLWLIPLAS
jgi:hypothetical protein